MCIKSEFRENCLKLAANVRSDESFLLISIVCPQGVFCPCSGAIYIYKIIKNVYKIRFRNDYFETSNLWAKREGLSVVIEILSPVDCLPLSGAIYIWWNMKKMYIKSDFKAMFFSLQQMSKVIRAFCWQQTFVSKGSFALAPGLYTCIKSLKVCIKSDFEDIILKLATIRQSNKGFLLTSSFVPKGLSAPALGLFTCIKTLKYIPGSRVRWAFWFL